MMFCPTKVWCENVTKKMREQFNQIEQKSPGLLKIDKKATEQVQLNLAEHGIKETSDIYKYCGLGKRQIRFNFSIYF